MKNVSQAWKENQNKTLVNESFVEISLDITDPDVRKDASPKDNGSIYISQTNQIVSEVNKNIVPYSTLEQNLWLLDNSRKIIPVDNYGDCGFIGNVLSGDNLSFTIPPVITINFTQVHPNVIPAITITWGTAYNEFATNFIIKVYNGNSVLTEKEITNNTDVKSIVTMDISNFDKITIQVLKWCLPNRRARIEDIFIGLNKVYTKRDLFSYKHTQSIDPVSTALSKDEITFSIDNSDNFYNPYNKNGLAKYLMERQEIVTRYGYKLNDGSIEWIQGGTFYLSEWDATQSGRTADFKARDILEYLSQVYYDGEYNASGVSLYNLALRLFEYSDLPLNKDGSLKWHLDESLKTIYSTAPLPVDTIANNLQMIAHAGCCVIYQDRSGIIHIEPINNQATDYAITLKNSYSKSNIRLVKPLKELIVYHYDYSTDEPTQSEIKLTHEITGDVVVVDNPLITSSERANIVGNWMKDYLKSRTYIESSWRADPRLDALDIVTNTNEFISNKVRMTEINYSYNGAFKGTGEGRVI